MRQAHLSIAAAAILLAATLVPAPAAAAGEPTYSLPAPSGTQLVVSQGNDFPTGRRANEVYAFDFVAAPGTARDFPVLAARGGTIIGLRTGVPDRRCRDAADGPRPACWRRVNYVLIDHGDGTSGLYMHLRQRSSPVKLRQVVSTGALLGTAGRSGWTDETGVQFQVQETPPWERWGRGGWFLTPSLPVAFSDPDVVAQHPDGVPETGDVVVSANPGSDRAPFRFSRRPVDLPAAVPWEPGAERVISSAYDADSPDGYGLSVAPLVSPDDGLSPGAVATKPPTDDGLDPFASPDLAGSTDPGTLVYPLFGGQLVYAGCASGSSASLGLMVVIRRELDENDYYAVHGHLSELDPAIVSASLALASGDPTLPFTVEPDQPLGTYGMVPQPNAAFGGPCAISGVATDPATGKPVDAAGAPITASSDLFVSILADATVSSGGEILGGTPISPEPLVGRGGYEGFAWWSGPMTARLADAQPGQPRAGWTRQAPASGSTVPFGEVVDLAARVRDAASIAEVRFRAWYPDWPEPGSTDGLTSFDPATTWRLLAVCRAPGVSGEPPRTRTCDWDGDGTSAVVSFAWDPTLPEATEAAPWLPVARTAMDREETACVPVSLGIEVVDLSGHVYSILRELPRPEACDDSRAAATPGARILALDPLVPPLAPVSRVTEEWRAVPAPPPPAKPDPLDGAIAWRDRADNEDGYEVYARRQWLEADCSITEGGYVLIETLPPDTKRYEPRHQRILRLAPAPDVPNVPGFMTAYRLFVSAFNEAGESERVDMGGFLLGGEMFCDTGLVEP